MSEYEDTPTPLSEMKDQQEVRLENGAEGVIHYYGSPYDKAHNKELRLKTPDKIFAFSEEMIAAAGMKLYKKMTLKDCVIVWEGVSTPSIPITLEVARRLVNEDPSNGTIYRLVPVNLDEEQDS